MQSIRLVASSRSAHFYADIRLKLGSVCIDFAINGFNVTRRLYEAYISQIGIYDSTKQKLVQFYIFFAILKFDWGVLSCVEISIFI